MSNKLIICNLQLDEPIKLVTSITSLTKDNSSIINKTIITPQTTSNELQKTLFAPIDKSINQITQFIRPNHYILHSLDKHYQLQRKKRYEASQSDINFLSKENNFIDLNQLENIIITIEDNIESKIGYEIIRNLIIIFYPHLDLKSVEKIAKYYMIRREHNKKSLLRDYWRKQKSDDKYVLTTFRFTHKEKMKLRTNQRQVIEQYFRLKRYSEINQATLLPIINSMFIREIYQKKLIKLNNLLFFYEFSKSYYKKEELLNKIIKQFMMLDNSLIWSMIQLPPMNRFQSLINKKRGRVALKKKKTNILPHNYKIKKIMNNLNERISLNN